MKLKSTSFSSKNFSLGFENAMVVDCEGRSGSLAILWKRDVDFSLLQFSNHHNHGENFATVEGELNHRKWRVTWVYGQPYTS